MSEDLQEVSAFGFVAHKVHIHRWPLDTPPWSPARIEEIGAVNAGRQAMDVAVDGKTVTVGTYGFDSIRKVGITVPPFRRECTLIFEGRCEKEFYAHVHLTTRSSDYAETFNRLTSWRHRWFTGA